LTTNFLTAGFTICFDAGAIFLIVYDFYCTNFYFGACTLAYFGWTGGLFVAT